MEFFNVARNLVKNTTLDPDVRRVFGSNVMIDFYMNSTIQWGIEFLYNRDRLEEHLQRFCEHWKYSFPLKQYIIVDFIPKGEDRSFSLTSCLCFTFHRIIKKNRFLL